ncbi:hypothetical protein N665_0453s0001 [Sinapis alba]|nr:hypothetical protein N665_0453s0001 [Sinapis alba]
MGCVWCKPSAIEDSKDSPRERFSNKSSSEYTLSRPVASSRREEPLRTKERPDVVSVVRPKQAIVSRGESLSSRREKKIENVAASNFPMGITIAKGVEGEYVAAGWPPWLASVAGEAIKGWVPRRADSFEKLDKVIFLFIYIETHFYWHVSKSRNLFGLQ